MFGVRPDFRDAAGDVAPRQLGELTLSKAAAEKLGATAGSSLSIAGATYTVAAVRGDAWFSHTPVVWMNLTDWQSYSEATGSHHAVATVLAVTGVSDDATNVINQQANTVTSPVSGSFDAIGGYKSENGSLMMMLAMLLAISGLVIGAFFTVWTIQRTGDIAILKALGASQWVLMRDAIGQALVVLGAGVGLGLALTVLLGQAAQRVVPFVVSVSTTVVPGLIMVALGVAGAAFALRIIGKSNPLAAMGSNR
jgi:putative ABC transport system permease protein